MIQPIAFLDVSTFAAMYVIKYKDRLEGGLLPLRDIKEGEDEPSDLPILKEWKGARAVLSRIKTGAAPFFNGTAPELGRAWLEALPPGTATPWRSEEGDYAEQHLRTRTCVVPSVAAWTYANGAGAILAQGMLHVVEHRALHCEANFGQNTRVHLIVDVRRPDPDAGND